MGSPVSGANTAETANFLQAPTRTCQSLIRKAACQDVTHAMHGFHVPPTLYSRPCWRDLPRHQSNLLPALQHPDFNSVPNMPGTSPTLYQSESNAGSDASGVENMSTSKRGEDVSSATCLQPRSFQVLGVVLCSTTETPISLKENIRGPTIL